MAMNFTSRILNQSTIYYGQSKGLKVANLPRSPKAKKDAKFSTKDWVLRSFYSAPKITNKISPPLSEHALDSVKIQSPKRASAAPTTQQSGTKAAEFRKSRARKHVPTYEGKPAVFFEQSRIDGVAKSEEFKFSLVGKFPRRRPSLELIRAWVGREWKLKGLWSITLLDSKHVLLRLDNEADMVYVWLRNRWFINGHLMRVFKWTPSFRTSDAEEPSLAAVWISLPLLPVAFFQQDLLYSIASLVGEVLCADGPTKNLSRTNVARVCVEVDLLEELPHRVYIGVGEAGFWQDINYEKLPFYCAGCRSFGHSTDICKFNKIGVEVDKSQENVRSHLEKPPEETKKQDGLQEFISRKNSYETCPVFRCKDVKSKLIARSSSQLAIKKCTIGESSKTRSWIEVVPSVVTQNFSSNWLDRMPCSSGLATKDTRTQGIDTLTRTYVLDRIENCQVCVSHHLDLKSKTVVEEEDTAKDDDHNDDNGVSGFNERKEYQRYQQDGQRQALGAADINSYLKSYLNQSPSSRKKFAFFWKRKPKEVEVPEYTHWGPLKKYSLKELRIATDGFCNRNIVGRGGFGKVYKGRLPDGSLVAVKRLNEERTTGGELQFLTEVEICSKVVHKNLLQLRGVCMAPTERILVYPYMANGSVATWLRGRPPNAPPLNWRVREQIAIGSAKGLAYLHDCCVPKIIHRDVKAANILLNENFEALVGDFGLGKFINIDNSHATSIIAGTFGYMAPEYLSTGKLTEKIDVFGYGVMLLELISGKRACDLTRLANDEAVMLFDWAKGLLREKKLDMLVDPDLQSNYVEAEVEQLIQVALLCTQNSPRYRPKMSEVVRMLEGNGLAERWEELQDVNDANSDWLVDYTSARQDVNDGNSDSPVDSTSALHPEELSSPR